MASLDQQLKLLFAEQTTNWAQAQKSYSDLAGVQPKSFSFGNFDVKVQFNPARIVSSGAKVDAKTIAERKCFLCAANRPCEQKSIDFGDYEILVNPFPIFPEHFTIPRREHVDQQIKPYFADMLQLAKAMVNYLVFYNGPKCGASAPDHMHFQAGTKDFLPLVNDYHRLKDTHANLLVSTETMQLFSFENYLRTVYCIESNDIESAKDSFEKFYRHFTSPPTSLLKEKGVAEATPFFSLKNIFKQEVISPLAPSSQKIPFLSPLGESPQRGIEVRGVGGEVEPMMNIVCTFENGKWFTFVLPRKAFRPWQYTAEGAQQLLVSPATVEMCGIFITPIKEHFDKITKEDVVSILEQVS